MATLAHLVQDVDARLLRVASASAGLVVPVSTVVLFDPVHTRTLPPESVVCAVGIAATSPEAVDLLQRAGTSGVAGVAVKSADEPPPALIDASEQSGTALLVVDPDLPWTEVYTLLAERLDAVDGQVDSGLAAVPIGDLFALADVVAAMAGGPVTIEDTQSRVLAYSTSDDPVDETRLHTILNRRSPDACVQSHRESGVFDRMWKTAEPVRVDTDGCDHPPRLAIAVHAGGEVLGSIWVAEGKHPLDQQAEAGLRRAAPIVALHLARRRLAEEADRRRRAEAMEALFEAGATEPLTALGAPLAMDRPVTVLGIQPRTDDPAERMVRLNRAVGFITLTCESYSARSLTAVLGTTIYVLVQSNGTRERVVAFAEDLVDRCRDALHVDISIGIGSQAANAREAGLSRREADRVLGVLQHSDATLATIEQAQTQAILSELLDLACAHPELVHDRLRSLLEPDEKDSSVYAETLRAYFATGGDIARAARTIPVHPNTFRYRLGRLVRLAGLDLAQPDDRFVAELQVRLADRQRRNRATS